MSKPSPDDKRTLVDRFFDRAKNNRIIATIIVVTICLVALSNFTDSMQKLLAHVPQLSRTEVQGEWKSEQVDLHGAGQQTIIFKIKEISGGHLAGSLRFYDQAGRPATPEFDLLHGKRDGNKLSFSFDGGAKRTLDSGKTYIPVPETISGDVQGNLINFVYERADLAAVSFSAHRLVAAQSGGA